MFFCERATFVGGVGHIYSTDAMVTVGHGCSRESVVAQWSLVISNYLLNIFNTYHKFDVLLVYIIFIIWQWLGIVNEF